MRLPLFMLCLAALLLIDCKQATSGPEIGRLPVLTSDDPQAEAEVREANELASHGQQARAAKKYREFLHARPDDALVPLVQLALGKIVLAQQHDGEALALFSSVAQHPEPAVAEQGRFYAAIANQRLGHNAEAIEALSPMVGRTIEPADTLLLLKTLNLAYQAENKLFEAIATLEQLQRDTALPQTERDAAKNQIAQLVSKASPAEVRRAIDELDPKGFAFKLAIVRGVKDADAARDLERTRQLLAVIQEHNLPLDDELAAIQLRAAAPSDANPQAVGALLSLSGRARRVGEQALRGLMLASGLPASGPKPPNAPSVVFRDDGGDPARAVQAVNELVTQHRVIAIVGPLDAQVAMAAGARAQELGVPLLALTPAGTPNSLGNMVFRYFPTPQSEARALAEAAKARGAGSFAVLYPQNAYGEALLAAFEKEAQALGMRATLVTSYAPGATSFGSEAAALQKENFDALFIPDSSQQLALIAPALAAAGLWSAPRGAAAPKDTGASPHQRASKSARNIVVLAPSVGFDTNLPRLAGRYLQGALFSVPFDAQSGEAPVPEFVQQYQEAFGSAPDMFAAFAHDAYRLIRSAVDNGATTRAALAAKLPAARDQGLVTPTEGFTATREANGATRVIELQGDAFAPPR
jgi:branched-chain amino acid transport system substrate-binding protein